MHPTPAEGAESDLNARTQAERLLELSLWLASAATLADVSDATMQAAKRAFPDTAGAIIARRSANEKELEIFAVSDLPGQIFENWQRFSLHEDAPLAEVVRTGDVIALNSPTDWETRYPHLLPLLSETGHRAQLVCPLVAGGMIIGSLGIAFTTDRTFTADEAQLAVALSSQCAVALERARLYENERKAREAAETANQSKSDFMARLSHELRTPLNAIGGYADLIEIGIHGPVTAEQRAVLQRIQTSQKHIQGLISSVLEFSRIEAGATQYHLLPVNLEDTISVCETLTSPQIQEKHLHYVRNSSDLSIEVYADAEKLRQILVNLLTNAIKYTDPNGRISLTVERDPENVRVMVADTGHGIEATNLDLIFQPFVRLHSSTGVVDGVGLGLPISRSLARGMRGDITAESKPGTGSTFTLILPCTPSATT